MSRPSIATLLLVALVAPAAAQPSIKILQPAEDTCAAFVQAMDAKDATQVLSLGGWALGFLSGVAEGRQKDILHDTTSEGVLDRLYAACQAQPAQPISSILETMARSLAAAPD